MKNITARLLSAIKAERFNYEKYLNGGTWYGSEIITMPLFCSYGQIGYSVLIENKTQLSFDWELKKIEIFPQE